MLNHGSKHSKSVIFTGLYFWILTHSRQQYCFPHPTQSLAIVKESWVPAGWGGHYATEATKIKDWILIRNIVHYNMFDWPWSFSLKIVFVLGLLFCFLAMPAGNVKRLSRPSLCPDHTGWHFACYQKLLQCLIMTDQHIERAAVLLCLYSYHGGCLNV